MAKGSASAWQSCSGVSRKNTRRHIIHTFLYVKDGTLIALLLWDNDLVWESLICKMFVVNTCLVACVFMDMAYCTPILLLDVSGLCNADCRCFSSPHSKVAFYAALPSFEARRVYIARILITKLGEDCNTIYWRCVQCHLCCEYTYGSVVVK